MSRPDQKVSPYEQFKGMMVWLTQEMVSWIMLVSGTIFAVLILNLLLSKAGFGVRAIPALGELTMVYIAAIFWLYRGGKL